MRRLSMASIALLVLLVPFVQAAAAAADVRAWLDRGTMHLGETVTLNVEAQQGAVAQPDFSALKQDFDLLGTQSSQQVSIVNGKSTSKTLWAIGLEPKHAGSITIAPIRVGAAQTAPIALNVLAVDANATPKGASGDVFLEVDAEPLTPYVQQEVRYTAKLYYAFDLTDGNLSEPKVDGIGVQRLGQDKSYVATLGGRRYHVVERHYALTPEKSGAIEMPPLVFRGTALDVSDPTGFFSRGRNVSAQSDPVHLDVKPKPAAWTDGAWLPAAAILLKDESELPAEVHVGEPVTRTVRLQAQGLGYEQLPELELRAPEGADIYPDKADTRTRDDGEWLYGERVRKFAFVPNRAGKLTIPGVQVHWWDVVNDRAATTQLAARTITVLPAGGGSGATTPATGGAAARAAPAGTAPAASGAAPAVRSPGPAVARVSPLWPALALLGFGLWLVTLALWWRSRRAPRQVANVAASRSGDAAARAAFLRACALGELAGAERALLAWARSERADVRNLGEIAARLDAAAQRDALADLQRARYAGAAGEGIGARLQRAFKGGLAWRVNAARGVATALPALYPERD